MNTSMKFAVSAAFACGFSAMASSPAASMPARNLGVDVGPVTEEAHAVRVCNRYRCWWTYAGHYHPRYYGYYRHPHYWHGGYRYGWRHPYYRHHYGYGWHHGYGYRHHWR